MTPLLWQALLFAELPAKKGRVLLKELGPLNDSGLDTLRNHSILSPKERARIDGLDPDLLASALKQGIRPVGFGEYPEPLRNWADNPIGLFAWGDWSAAHRPTIGIVGTRGATTYGKAVATKFAEALAGAGATVVSGGALGIDAAAHKGAMTAGGKTIAVLGGGVDKLYPALHRGLFQQIREGNGCLVSQFACGVKPDYYRFLMRNQLIAALSQAVIVIEAPERSGALSTAHRANELGRQVFVVPANIDNINFRGSHALIRDGATLVDHPDHILETLQLEKTVAPSAMPEPSSTGAAILGVLTTTPLAVEFIVERSGLPMHEVMSELTLLELDGRILRDAGGYALRP